MKLKQHTPTDQHHQRVLVVHGRLFVVVHLILCLRCALAVWKEFHGVCGMDPCVRCSGRQ